jgi:lipoyl(octanoyl) transferase
VNVLNVIHYGQVPYSLGLRLQAELVEARKAGKIANTLLLLEHTPVVTLGRNAKRQNVVAPAEMLARRGVEVYECDRGGDVTFHGPGQLVGYPIVDLYRFSPRMGAVDFVRRMEEALIRTCADFRIAAGPVKGLTGVWVEGARKIAAIGIHVSRGVTSHGFALNVNNDLDYFRLIVPCGISDKPVTSMARELGAEQALETVAQAVARSFGQVFDSQVLWLESVDELLGRKLGMPLQTPEPFATKTTIANG